MIEYQPDSKNKEERHKICINFKSVNRISIEDPVITLYLTEQYVQSKRESLQVKMKKKLGGSDKMISKPTWVWRELSSQSSPGQLTECPVIHKVCMKLMNSNSKLKVNHFQDFIEQMNTDPQLKTAMEGTAQMSPVSSDIYDDYPILHNPNLVIAVQNYITSMKDLDDGPDHVIRIFDVVQTEFRKLLQARSHWPDE